MRYFIRPLGDQFQLVKQDDDLGDIDEIGVFDTFDKAVAKGNKLNSNDELSVAYNGSDPDIPEEWANTEVIEEENG